MAHSEQGESADMRIARSLLEATLGAHLKALLLGGKITAECLQSVTALKVGHWYS
jgi:hypothetical protein